MCCNHIQRIIIHYTFQCWKSIIYNIVYRKLEIHCSIFGMVSIFSSISDTTQNLFNDLQMCTYLNIWCDCSTANSFIRIGIVIGNKWKQNMVSDNLIYEFKISLKLSGARNKQCLLRIMRIRQRPDQFEKVNARTNWIIAKIWSTEAIQNSKLKK